MHSPRPTTTDLSLPSNSRSLSPVPRDRRKLTALLASTALGALLLDGGPALAACVFVPTPGNDSFICDSGISAGGLTDLDGSNTLTFPAGGSGTLNGNVVFGAGADTIDMETGTISGTVNQGAGADSFNIGGGTVTGNVQQGSGIDSFRMTGGQIQSLSQGDNLDDFFMSDGRIVDFFEDGDRARMTGGRIGRVDMKLDNNIFDMSGGAIDRNLVTGFGNDTIIVSGGTIGGSISVSGGTDSVTVTGGSIGGNVLMSFGTDSFTWAGGGIIYGTVDLGQGDDTATLRDLNNGHLGSTKAFNGNLGVDHLTLDNVSADGVARFQNWETIGATNDTELIFDGALVLGDSGTGTGTLTVDASSTLYGGQAHGGVAAFTAGEFANVVNAGRIDLTNGGSSTSDSFTIAGNYRGDGSVVLLQTELGDDSSSSDKLVISGGAASGTSSISILNVGGAGAATTANGILVIEAVNGGSTATGAFALNGAVAAGAYEYLLFRGGVTNGSEENWYLRSTLVTPPSPETPPPDPAPTPPVVDPTPPVAPEPPEPAPPPPPPVAPPPPVPPEATPGNPDPVDPAPPVEPGAPAPETPPAPPPAPPPASPPPPPEPPTQPAPVPDPVDPVPPPTPGATRVEGEVVPLYRIEVPTYAVVPPAAHYLGTAMLGTFHERRGEQSLLQGGGFLPATWGRLFGQDAEVKWSGTVAPTFDGSLAGFQAGFDLYGFETASGHHDRAGIFVGYARMTGDVKGQALGWNDLSVGDFALNGTSFGGYWTHVGPGGWYLDGVVMGTWFDGRSTSTRDIGVDIDGTGITASLEGGYPIALTTRWALEPQAQLIWQSLSLDDQRDRFSTVAFDDASGVTGRIGLRLQGDLPEGGVPMLPYLKANLWHAFDSDQRLTFGTDSIVTELGGTSLELGGGVVAKLTDQVSLHLTGDYTTNLGGEKQQIFEGNIGLSVKW